ncbi:hypothetical protein C0J52_12146 [Blattella germanica]|nr:hypothetical protein C0J52_12146 [Blattella germanica]
MDESDVDIADGIVSGNLENFLCKPLERMLHPVLLSLPPQEDWKPALCVSDASSVNELNFEKLFFKMSDLNSDSDDTSSYQQGSYENKNGRKLANKNEKKMLLNTERCTGPLQREVALHRNKTRRSIGITFGFSSIRRRSSGQSHLRRLQTKGELSGAISDHPGVFVPAGHRKKIAFQLERILVAGLSRSGSWYSRERELDGTKLLTAACHSFELVRFSDTTQSVVDKRRENKVLVVLIGFVFTSAIDLDLGFESSTNPYGLPCNDVNLGSLSTCKITSSAAFDVKTEQARGKQNPPKFAAPYRASPPVICSATGIRDGKEELQALYIASVAYSVFELGTDNNHRVKLVLLISRLMSKDVADYYIENVDDWET